MKLIKLIMCYWKSGIAQFDQHNGGTTIYKNKSTVYNNTTTAYNNKTTSYDSKTTSYDSRTTSYDQSCHIRQLWRSILWQSTAKWWWSMNPHTPKTSWNINDCLCWLLHFNEENGKDMDFGEWYGTVLIFINKLYQL